MSTDEPSRTRSGLPTSGAGSPASWFRRFIALVVDWAIANVAAVMIVGSQVWDAGSGLAWVPLVCWFVLVWSATVLTGASLGQWVLRIRIIDLRGVRVGVATAALRTGLILLVIPPLVIDREGRGLHDILTNTAAVNAPRATA